MELVVIIFGFTIPEVTIIIGFLSTVLGCCKRYNITPRRVLGWLVAVKMKETDQATAKYWKKEYEECSSRLSQCQDGR